MQTKGGVLRKRKTSSHATLNTVFLRLKVKLELEKEGQAYFRFAV
jgi:hypothetical protein